MPTNEIKWYVEVSSARDLRHQRNVGVGAGEMKGAEECARDLHANFVGVGTGEMKGAEECARDLHANFVGIGTGEMKGAIEGMKK